VGRQGRRESLLLVVGLLAEQFELGIVLWHFLQLAFDAQKELASLLHQGCVVLEFRKLLANNG
jgi:hypothetical protein